MSLKIYQYEKCGTCRRALNFLRRHGVAFTSLPIREHPPSRAELERMLSIYEGNIRRLFNTSGRDYKVMNLKTKLSALTTEKAIELLAGCGNLIKRPFALSDQSGRVGFEEEEWKVFLARGQ